MSAFDMPTAASLIAANEVRRQAVKNRDIAALEAITADEFYYAHINGLVEDRTEYLARARASSFVTHKSVARDVIAVVRPGCALLRGISFMEIQRNGTDERRIVETLFLSIWEHNQSHWSILAYAATPMPSKAV